MGFILPFIVSQVMGVSRPVKILAGAYLAGAVASGVKSYLDGDRSVGKIAKKTAFSWAGLLPIKRIRTAKGPKTTKKATTVKKIKTKHSASKKQRIMRAMRAFGKRTDAAAAANDTKALLGVMQEMQTFLKKEHAPKAVLQEVTSGLREVRKQLAKEAKAPATATATA